MPTTVYFRWRPTSDGWTVSLFFSCNFLDEKHANQLFWNTTFLKFRFVLRFPFCLEIFQKYHIILTKFRHELSCFSKPLPLRGTVPKTQTKNEKSQDKSKSSARCPTRVPCQVAHGDSERLQSHTDALRRHPPHRACGFRGVWLLILWVAPRLNPRAEPEHYIRAWPPPKD